MKSQQTLQAEAKTAPAMIKTQDITSVAARQLLERMKEIYQAVENRAYELFTERDYESGHDLEDWIRAEAEFLEPPPAVQVVETASQIIVMATMSDLTETSIEVGILPKRLVISGKKGRREEKHLQEKPALGKEGREFYCLLTLPCEVETANVKARARGNRLEIAFLKKNAAQEARVGINVA
jgi:HSP20 family molecular chaperone IbpA